MFFFLLKGLLKTNSLTHMENTQFIDAKSLTTIYSYVTTTLEILMLLPYTMLTPRLLIIHCY